MNQLHSKHVASIKGKDNLGLVLLFGTAYNLRYTVCPRSSDPFYIVIYYIKWVTTSWTYSSDKHVLFLPGVPWPSWHLPLPRAVISHPPPAHGCVGQLDPSRSPP